MNVDGVRNGIVLDHIAAGKSMEIYRLLNLDRLSCSVAVLQNVQSKKYGIKDMIKIDEMIDINLDIIGYIDPNITINIVKDNEPSIALYALDHGMYYYKEIGETQDERFIWI